MDFIKRLAKPLAILWVVWTIVTYLLFQPDITQVIFANPYMGTITLLAVIGLAGHFILRSWKNRFNWRGIYWFPAILVASLIIIPSYLIKAELGLGSFLTQFFYYSFFSFILALGLFLLFSSSRVLGHLIYNRWIGNADESYPFTELALGISLQAFLGTLLGLAGWFHAAGIAIIISLPLIIGYKTFLNQAKETLLIRRTVTLSKNWEWPLYLALLSALTINWISSIKPFPTGNDGAILYMALSHKLVETGSLPTGGQSFAWSVFMAFGEALFKSDTVSILLSHSMVFLCLAALFRLSRNWLKKPFALMTVVTAALAPFMGFHAIIDEKIDLALLFLTLTLLDFSLRKVIKPRLKSQGSSQRELIRVLAVIGWLCGFCFSVKYTFILTLFALIPLLIFRKYGSISGCFLILIGIFVGLEINTFGAINLSSLELGITTSGFVLMGILLIVRESEWMQSVKRAIPLAGILILGMVIPFTPWMVKHLSETEGISLQNMLEGEKEKPVLLTDPLLFGSHETGPVDNRNPLWDIEEAKAVPMGLPQGKFTSPKAVEGNQSVYEELQRYLGFEDGFWRLASLPTDLTFSINIARNRYVNIGFLFLCLMPLLFFVKGRPVSNGLLLLGGVLGTIFSVVSINEYNSASKSADRILLAVDQVGNQPDFFKPAAQFVLDYLVHPLFHLGRSLDGLYDIFAGLGQGYSALLITIFCLGLAWVFRFHIKSWKTSFKLFTLYIALTGLAWWLFGMGVVWYSLASFVLIPAVLIHLASGEVKLNSLLGDRFIQRLFLSVIGLQLLVTLLMYFSNPRVGGYPPELFVRPNLKYATDVSYSAEDALGEFNPDYPEVIRLLNEDPEGKIYLINTQLGYHIDNYDGRVFEDNLVTSYGADQRKYGDKLDYARSLSVNGFKYLLFDMNTYTMDKTPERRLATRSAELIRQIYDSEWAELVLTDNYVYDEASDMITLPNGQRSFARKGIIGETIYRGTFMLFKIK